MQSLVRRLIQFLLVISAVGLLGCGAKEHPLAPLSHGRGEVVRSRFLGTMTTSDLQQSLAARNVQVPFTLAHSVASVALDYYTVDAHGNQTIASGAFLFPEGASALPLASIQHGTESKRDLVASVSPLNSTEGTIGLIMASMGYAVVVPDYLGFGVSTGIHPYLHDPSTTPCVIDFMRAARSYSTANGPSLNGHVFLIGYSEGGYASLAVQKEIEEHLSAEFHLTAVAPMSGPYDLEGMVQTVFHTGTYVAPAYIAYFLTAYNDVYGWDRLGDIFKAPYASAMPRLFDGSKTWGEVTGQLPSTFAELMDSTFISHCLDGSEAAVFGAIHDNTLLDWTPMAPVHFFHGDADAIVPIAHAQAAMAAFTSNGAPSVQLTVVPGGTHETSGPYAVIGAIQWFESMRGASQEVPATVARVAR